MNRNAPLQDYDLCDACHRRHADGVPGHDLSHSFYRVRARAPGPRPRAPNALGPMGVEMQAGERLGPSAQAPSAPLVPEVELSPSLSLTHPPSLPR